MQTATTVVAAWPHSAERTDAYLTRTGRVTQALLLPHQLIEVLLDRVQEPFLPERLLLRNHFNGTFLWCGSNRAPREYRAHGFKHSSRPIGQVFLGTAILVKSARGDCCARWH
jgi:hypothetical protein